MALDLRTGRSDLRIRARLTEWMFPLRWAHAVVCTAHVRVSPDGTVSFPTKTAPTPTTPADPGWLFPRTTV